MGWQGHQIDHIQVTCTSLQTDNHAITSTVKFFTVQIFFQSSGFPTKSIRSIEGTQCGQRISVKDRRQNECLRIP